MNKRLIGFMIVLIGMIGLVGCGSGEEKQGSEGKAGERTEIMVMAAASLTDALNELKTSFESEHPGISVTYSFGGSGKLAQQIEQGRRAMCFFRPARKIWTDCRNKI